MIPRIYPLRGKQATNCNGCGETIEAHQPRITIVSKDGLGYIRSHYHWDDCGKKYLSDYLDKLPSSNAIGGRGRPGIGLSPEEYSERHKHIKQLWYLEKKYGKVALAIEQAKASKNITAIDTNMLIDYGDYLSRRSHLTTILETLGGIPKRYR